MKKIGKFKMKEDLVSVINCGSSVIIFSWLWMYEENC